MRVTALGHAGLKVETSRATLLVDPWFSRVLPAGVTSACVPVDLLDVGLGAVQGAGE